MGGGCVMGRFNFFKKKPSLEMADIEEVARGYVDLFKDTSRELAGKDKKEKLAFLGSEIPAFAGYDLANINFYLSKNGARVIKDEMAFGFIADRASLYLMGAYLHLEKNLGEDEAADLCVIVFNSIYSDIASSATIKIDQDMEKFIKKLILETTDDYILEGKVSPDMSSYSSAMCYKRIKYNDEYIVFKFQYEPIAIASSLFFHSLVLSKF
jgi:hypothetical protein